jgi:hypothetical protein
MGRALVLPGLWQMSINQRRILRELGGIWTGRIQYLSRKSQTNGWKGIRKRQLLVNLRKSLCDWS